MARSSRTSEPTEPTEDATPEVADEVTEDTTPEPTEPDTDATDEATDDGTDTDDERDPTEVAVEAWNAALDASDEDGVVPVDATTELVNAYNALPGRVAPAEFRSKVQGATVEKAMEDPTDPDRSLLTAMQSLFATLDAADSSPASAPVDPTEVWIDKVRALAVLADEVRTEIPDDPYGSGTVRDAVADELGDDLLDAWTALADQRPDDIELGDAWKASAFGGRTPKPGRTKRSGGSRTTKGRDLANVPDGDVVYTYKGDTFTATVDGDTIVTEDGEVHTSPTGAAKHLNGGTSVNGWTAFERDGRDLATVHDDATDDDDE